MPYYQKNYTVIDKHLATEYSIYFSNIDDKPDYEASRALLNLESLSSDSYYSVEDYNTYLSTFHHSTLPPYFTVEFTCNYSLSISSLNSHYFKTLSSVYSPINQLYPIAVRYISSDGLYYIERPPFQVDVDYKIARASSNTKRRFNSAKIWIPWTIFVFNPSNPNYFHYYFADKALSSFEDEYIVPYLPNTYPEGAICFSNSLQTLPFDHTTSSFDVKALYSLAINEFFAGGWNSDLGHPHRQLIDTFVYSHNSSEVSEKYKNLYPDLYAFLYPTEDQLLPLIKSSKVIRTSFELSQRYSTSIFNYLHEPNYHYVFLYLLSQLNLQQTLSLISQIINYRRDRSNHNNSLTFSDIIDKTSASSHADNHDPFDYRSAYQSIFSQSINDLVFQDSKRYKVLFNNIPAHISISLFSYNNSRIHNVNNFLHGLCSGLKMTEHQSNQYARIFFDKLFSLPPNHRYTYDFQSSEFTLCQSDLSDKDFYLQNISSHKETQHA